MRYECIALSLGCSGSATTPLGLDSCLSAAFPGVVTFSLPMSHTRITSMYSHIIFLRHCDEEILAAEHKKLSPPGLLMTINCKNPPLVYQNWPWKHRGQGCSQSPPQLPSLPLITKIKYRILNVFTFPSHPFLFLFKHGQPCSVLGAWHDAQAKRVPGNRRGCAFGPNYCSQPPSIAIAASPSQVVPLLRENTSTPPHTQLLSLAILQPAREAWQRQWVGVFSGDECQTDRGKPHAQAVLGASYNERHLRRTWRDRKRVKDILSAWWISFSYNCLNPLTVKISNNVKWDVPSEICDFDCR